MTTLMDIDKSAGSEDLEVPKMEEGKNNFDSSHLTNLISPSDQENNLSLQPETPLIKIVFKDTLTAR